MGIDEALFERLHGWFTRRGGRDDRQRADRRVLLADHQRRLATLASLLAGREIEVRPCEDHGGLGPDRLFLPTALDWAPDRGRNLEAYLLRVALGVAALDRHRGMAPARDRPPAELEALLEAGAALADATRRWPGLRGGVEALAPAWAAAAPPPRCAAHGALRALERIWLGLEAGAAELGEAASAWARGASRCARVGDAAGLAACAAAWRSLSRPRRSPPFDLRLFGDLRPPAAAGSAAAGAIADAEAPTAADALPTGTEHRARPQREVERVELSEQEDQSPLIHVFEKVKTAEEHQAGRREIDGSDELGEHLDALDELDLRRVLRTRRPAASIYRADLALDAAPVELEDDRPSRAGIPYDEWDERVRAYRSGWCSVFVEHPSPAEPAGVAAAVRAVRSRNARAIQALRAEFERVERARAKHRRQTDGPDIDLDAVVDRHASLLAVRSHGGRVDDERLYLRQRPHHHDLATLVLLDASLSTDAWVENRRVLDVARESVIVLGEVLRDIRLEVAVAAFFSNARRDCRFQLVKDFREAWPIGHARLFGVRPTGYTRIGPALRHATSLLRASPCRRKLLLLISDGKATDYDQYEGRHGVADVRQALRESQREGVRTIALTVDAKAPEHLPRMFGRHGYRVIRHPGQLPMALARLHERVFA
jgi:Mg-chelatase subunit ChlD